MAERDFFQTVPLELVERGRIHFVRAQLPALVRIPFATVTVWVTDPSVEYHLRLDMSKEAFMDSLGDPALDALLKEVAPRVVERLCEEWSPGALATKER